MGNRLGRRNPTIQAFDFGDEDGPILVIPQRHVIPEFEEKKLNLKLTFKSDFAQDVIYLIWFCQQKNIPIDVGRYVIIPFWRKKVFFFDQDFGEPVCLKNIKKERIDEEENSGWVLSSNNIFLSEFDDYVMFNETNQGYNIEFPSTTDVIWEKIKNYPIIKSVHEEVKNYIKDHNHISYCYRPYVPRNPEEYINNIVMFSNQINIKKLHEKHPKLKMVDTDEIVTTISTKKNRIFFNLIHMTFTEQKLFMDKNWKTDLSEETFISYETFEKAVDMIMYIKESIGICKSIKFIIKPKNQSYIKFNVCVCLKICYSTSS